MLYQIRPDGTTRWVDHIGRQDFAAVDEHGGDLDRLDWLAAERVLDTETLRLAIRFGRVSRVGLIVDAGDLVVLDQPRRVREAHAAATAHRPAQRQVIAKLEQILPGSTEAEDVTNASVDASTANTLSELDAKLQETWRVAPELALVRHWLDLGGTLPDLL
ncbi:hypothetical protein [Cellulomonas soli]|uniref:Uncharacterized protein n=1 Tax=Cellulomonas soli TaxID=931535 RepID=A0A512P9F9_9CELL|nr:hypothetical protein [Cellulomonas soli]NYI60327.1 hypothetical protein [Cellulomonas soli]GEP67839.1 hypothetical protein CSO01_05540 [Cellulomonas soli]